MQFEKRISKIFIRKIFLDEDRGILIICLSNGYIKEYDFEHFKFVNEMDCLNIKFDYLKNISLISSVEHIKDINMIFVAIDNDNKKFVALKNNKYFNLLKGNDIYFN